MTKTNGFFITLMDASNKPSILDGGGYNALQAVISVSLEVGLCNFLGGSLVGVDVRLNTKSCLLGVVQLSLNVTHFGKRIDGYHSKAALGTRVQGIVMLYLQKFSIL